MSCGEGTGASSVSGRAGVPKRYVSRVSVSTRDLVVGTRSIQKRNFFPIDVEGEELAMLNDALAHLDSATA